MLIQRKLLENDFPPEFSLDKAAACVILTALLNLCVWGWNIASLLHCLMQECHCTMDRLGQKVEEKSVRSWLKSWQVVQHSNLARDYSWSHFTSGRSTRELIETGETEGAVSSHSYPSGGLICWQKKEGITKDKAERSRLCYTLGLSSSVAILIFSPISGSFQLG